MKPRNAKPRRATSGVKRSLDHQEERLAELVDIAYRKWCARRGVTRWEFVPDRKASK